MPKYLYTMKSNPLRFILSLSIGVIATYFITIFFQSLAPNLIGYPSLEEGADVDRFERYLQELPLRANIAIVTSAILGVFFFFFAAARIVPIKKSEAALGVGIFCTVIYLFMVIAFAFPIGLAMPMLLFTTPFAYIGGRLADR